MQGDHKVTSQRAVFLKPVSTRSLKSGAKICRIYFVVVVVSFRVLLG